jgi:hypothetical protein
MDHLDYGPWEGGKLAGWVRSRFGALRLFYGHNCQAVVRIADYPSELDAITAMNDIQWRWCHEHDLVRNVYRRVHDTASGRHWYEMKLTQGKTLLFDEEDLPLATRFTWCASRQSRTFYALTHTSRKADHRGLRFHVEALATKGIDHLNGDGTFYQLVC